MERTSPVTPETVAEGAELGHGLRQQCGVEIGDGDGRALLEKQPGDFAADAGGAPADERAFALEFQHYMILSKTDGRQV
jgi:hypothetical protein